MNSEHGIKAIRLRNLRHLMATIGSSKGMAERLGVTPGYISQIKNGTRNIGDDFAAKLEAAFHKMPGWMDHDHDQIQDSGADVQDGPPSRQLIPLISWVQAGNFADVIDNYHPGDAEELLPCPMASGRHAFALTIHGPSMEPEYRDGDIIYVDPDIQPVNGSHVVARSGYSGQATFKKLIIDGGRYYLQALNPDWPSRIIPVDDLEIIGVVFFSGRKR
jgi:SOS-response transcriptional repressor LexA